MSSKTFKPIVFMVLLVTFVFPAFSQTVDFSVSTTQGCVPLRVSFSNLTTNRDKYTYLWNLGDGLISDTVPGGEVLYTTPGKKTVTLIAYSNGVEVGRKSLVEGITVFRRPVVTINSKDKVCKGQSLTFSITKTAGDAPISSYLWDLGNGTLIRSADPTIVFDDPKVKQVQLIVTDTNGCDNGKNPVSKAITVDPNVPVPSFSSSNYASMVTCDPTASVQFKDGTPAIAGVNFSYSWNFGDGSPVSTSKTPAAHSYTRATGEDIDAKTISLIVTGDNGCSASTQQTFSMINFNPTILVSFDKSGTQKACPGSTVVLSATGSGAEYISSYNWGVNDLTNYNHGTGKTDQVMVGTDSKDDYTVAVGLKASAFNGVCQATTTSSFTVEKTIDYVLNNNGVEYCGKTVFESLAITGSVPLSKVDWSVNGKFFESTTGTTSSAYKFSADSDYVETAVVTSENKCSMTLNGNLYFRAPVATVETAPVQQGCSPLTVEFTNLSTYKSKDPKNWYIDYLVYDFGDGSVYTCNDTDEVVSHTYTYSENTDGVYNTVITVHTTKGGSCTDAVKHLIKVGNPVVINYKLSDDTICGNEKLWYYDKSTPATKVDSASVTFTNVNDASVTVMKSSPAENNPISDLEFIFKPVSKDKDGTGWYNIHVEVFHNGCKTSLDSLQKVYVKGPFAYAGAVPEHCAEPFKPTLVIDAINNATNTTKTKWLLYEKASKSPFDSVLNPTTKCLYDSINYVGRYYATLYAMDGSCVDSQAVSFSITNTQAKYAMSKNPLCFGENAIVSVAPMSDQFQYLTSLTWDTNGVKKSFRKDLGGYYYQDTLTFSKRGKRTITVTATDENTCVDTTKMVINVYGPQIGFKRDSIMNCNPTLTFTDTSISERPIVRRDWYTNGTAKQFLNAGKTVTDTYDQPHYYDVKLVVADDFGCTADTTKKNYVRPIFPGATIKIPNPKVCFDTVATFEVDKTDKFYRYDNVTYTWTIGEGVDILVFDNAGDVIRYQFSKEYTNLPVTLVASIVAPSGETCTNTTTSNILQVKDLNKTNELLDTVIYEHCYESALNVTPRYTADFTYRSWIDAWIVPGSDTVKKYKGNGDRSDMIVTGTGKHELTLDYKTDYAGCREGKIVSEYRIGNYDLKIVSVDNACIKNPVTFKLEGDTALIYKYFHNWTFGDMATNAVDITPVDHVYKLTGDKVVKFQVIHNNCTEDVTEKILYINEIKAAFDRGIGDKDVQGCPPYTVTFDSQLSQGDQSNFVWDFGDGQTATGPNPTHTFTDANKTYRVTLNVTGGGCKDTAQRDIATLRTAELSLATLPTICEDSVLQINANPGVGTAVTKWDDNSSIVSKAADLSYIKVKADTTTEYHVYSVYTATGCTGVDTVKVKVQMRPSYHGAPDNFFVYLPDDTLKDLSSKEIYTYVEYNFNNDSLPGITYTWAPSEGLSCTKCYSPDVMITHDMVYTVTMSDTLGCFTEVRELSLKAILESAIALPTAFTPNADGSNDDLIPRGWGIKEFMEIKIYNRWGQKVFESNDIEKGWDGTFNGRPQDADTFAWTIKFKDNRDQVQSKKGYITLLR